MEILYFVKNFKKNGCICTTLVGGWEALGPFKLCVRCLLESKSVFSSCRWKRYRVLFLMELQVFPLVVWFCTGELFFFPFFSLSFLKKLQFGSTSILALLISIFWSRPFCRYFIGYWFRHNINLPKIIFFYVVLIVWISNFFLGSF